MLYIRARKIRSHPPFALRLLENSSGNRRENKHDILKEPSPIIFHYSSHHQTTLREKKKTRHVTPENTSLHHSETRFRTNFLPDHPVHPSVDPRLIIVSPSRPYVGEFEKRGEGGGGGQDYYKRESHARIHKREAEEREGAGWSGGEYPPKTRRGVIALVASSWRLMVVVVYGGGHGGTAARTRQYLVSHVD